MKEVVWEQGVLPILVTGAPFIGITTLGDELNYVSRMSQVKNASGTQTIVKTVSVYMACQSCMMKGVGAECKHVGNIMPYFHNPEKHRDIQLLMSGSRETYSRETRGIQANDRERPAFPEEALARLLRVEHAWRPSGAERPRHVFVAIDPCGGGHMSRFAVVSATLSRESNRFVLLGGESMIGGGPVHHGELVARHILELSRRNEELRSARFVLVPESNMAYVGASITNSALSALRNVYRAPPVTVLTESRGEHIGIRTTNGTKMAAALAVVTLLLENRLCVHHRFLCVGGEVVAGQQDARLRKGTVSDGQEMLTEIVRQMRNFKCIEKPPPPSRANDPDAQPTIIYSGKGGGNFDDHVIAVMIACSSAPSLFYGNKEDYKEFM